MISRDDVSDTLWRWRYKVSHLGKRAEKSLDDFSSDSLFLEKGGSAGTPGSKTAPDAAPSKEPGIGSTPSVKAYYEGPMSREGRYDWVDYPPKQLSKSAARAQDRVAIKAFKIKDKDKPVISGRAALKYHMIEVQNPQLVAVLGEVLKKQDVHLDSNENATFNEPFRALYFGYEDIVAKYKTIADDDPVKTFLLLFIRLLDEILGETRVKVKHLRASGLVSFKLAWTYFPKDGVVISWGNNCELLCKVVDTAYKKTVGGAYHLELQCKVLRFNGNAFIWQPLELEISGFAGNRPILDLSHYPLEFHLDGEAVKARLIDRGKRVLDYQGLTYCQYEGLALHQNIAKKKMEKHNVNSRILIDVIGYNKHHLAQGVRENSDPESQKNIVEGTGTTSGASEKSMVGKRLSEEDQAKNKQAMLSGEDELMFLSPLLEGYALKNKNWLMFFVEDIAPLAWNDEAYDHLVYDEQQKDLVMSFVESHGLARPSIEDVIVGKGEGLIVLLSGPPGTGKTLTAEAVADRTHRPLFYLQAEDLGINAATLGENVKKVFEMATEWNAVILLDEADVFMAERHPHDIARNELVSIFLRELEYFRGIIFLTTNLYSTIDSAFRSRVSLHLLFSSLTPEARMVVWRKFLDRLPSTVKGKATITGAGANAPPTQDPHAELVEEGEGEGVPGSATEDLTDEDLKELAAWSLNGREIKNAVKMVKSWCDHKGYEMTLSRLENGIKVTSPHASKSSHEGDTSLYDD